MKSSTILYKFCIVFCTILQNVVIARKTTKNAKFGRGYAKFGHKSVKKIVFTIFKCMHINRRRILRRIHLCAMLMYFITPF